MCGYVYRRSRYCDFICSQRVIIVLWKFFTNRVFGFRTPACVRFVKDMYTRIAGKSINCNIIQLTSPAAVAKHAFRRRHWINLDRLHLIARASCFSSDIIGVSAGRTCPGNTNKEQHRQDNPEISVNSCNTSLNNRIEDTPIVRRIAQTKFS